MTISSRAKYVIVLTIAGVSLWWIEPTGWATIALMAGFTMGTFWGIHKEKVDAAYRSLKTSQVVE